MNKLITNERGRNGLTNSKFTENLKQPVLQTEFTASEIEELRRTLTEALDYYGGIGISANQLGIKKRACLIRTDETELFLVNPNILELANDYFVFWEGCLSLPKTIRKPIQTVRSKKIVIETDNLGKLTFEINDKKEDNEDKVSDETLRTVVIQHEIDHLNGITIMERRYKRPMVNTNTKFGRNDKVLMKSPEGEFVEIKYKKANNYFLKGYEIV